MKEEADLEELNCLSKGPQLKIWDSEATGLASLLCCAAWEGWQNTLSTIWDLWKWYPEKGNRQSEDPEETLFFLHLTIQSQEQFTSAKTLR